MSDSPALLMGFYKYVDATPAFLFHLWKIKLFFNLSNWWKSEFWVKTHTTMTIHKMRGLFWAKWSKHEQVSSYFIVFKNYVKPTFRKHFLETKAGMKPENKAYIRLGNKQ